MGHWGVKSYENDEAANAIDAGLEQVHGAAYESLMDDRHPMSYDDAQKSLANIATLAAAIDALREAIGPERSWDDWDENERLAFAGIVVRHAEFGVDVPVDSLDRAIAWLENETIEWDDATLRRHRLKKELETLNALKERT
jgi:hypothetical protein